MCHSYWSFERRAIDNILHVRLSSIEMFGPRATGLTTLGVMRDQMST